MVSDVGLTDVKAPKAAAAPSPPLRGGSLGRSLMGRFASLVRSEGKEGREGGRAEGGVSCRPRHDIQLRHLYSPEKTTRTVLVRDNENPLRYDSF